MQDRSMSRDIEAIRDAIVAGEFVELLA
jgi:hypothetical protein